MIIILNENEIRKVLADAITDKSNGKVVPDPDALWFSCTAAVYNEDTRECADIYSLEVHTQDLE